ncbi:MULTISPECIES: hypothetical protein [unclassified Burkholderia]|uniref:hypothetical protein n=1 Tax=unclassified Burkholderia TaxID=2613784 RepID=UPI00075808BD|nr:MULTISPECIES: hypothetical protein [unclassified Burkholderia]KUY50830.1 hypothetical protein WS45_28240 [Burkholderia sp. RF2-non_BP3]KUY82004.1 hypothetical protein WS46_15795 [Burkholderia sp. RF4-BP95]KUY95622.1 hypothetical protein WS48_17490 [Burkholderia sp. RF7-non_BP1]KUY98925.1 hypothetical protein WS49_18985 [Burkholderia sp. RF7-non_BP4]
METDNQPKLRSRDWTNHLSVMRTIPSLVAIVGALTIAAVIPDKRSADSPPKLYTIQGDVFPIGCTTQQALQRLVTSSNPQHSDMTLGDARATANSGHCVAFSAGERVRLVDERPGVGFVKLQRNANSQAYWVMKELVGKPQRS